MIQPCMGVTASTPLVRAIWPILRKIRLFTRRSWAGMTCGASHGGDDLRQLFRLDPELVVTNKPEVAVSILTGLGQWDESSKEG